LFEGLKNDPYLNEYVNVLTRFDQFLAQGQQLDKQLKQESKGMKVSGD
jgi:hypothetical protein